MTLEEAVAIVAARPGHGRYRDLCDPNHPDFNPDYGPVVMRLAGADPAEYPGLFRQAANLAGAAGRAAAAVVRGEPVRVPADVHAARLAICTGCEHNGAAPAGVHCRKCGCGGAKLQLATEACPVGKW